MIAVIGAGAFGTALALTLARKEPVTLWGRNRAEIETMQRTRQTGSKLPGYDLPETIRLVTDIRDVYAKTVLLCIPTQHLAAFMAKEGSSLMGEFVACCKGIDLKTGYGPARLVDDMMTSAVLTGPSFAVDLANGLPTALTLAHEDDDIAEGLQARLSTPQLRIYRTTDVTGAELGGALKNVIAIACGVVAGARLGQSAIAATMTRGFAEVQRYALAKGADPRTLQGLSGFGDLVLTCTSTSSRNYRYGRAIGAGVAFDPNVTVEGRATAEAILPLARAAGIDMPICETVAALVRGDTDVAQATAALMQRPLKEE